MTPSEVAQVQKVAQGGDSLPVEVQEKGRGVGLMGFLLRLVELCSFHVLLHKDPLTICREGEQEKGHQDEHREESATVNQEGLRNQAGGYATHKARRLCGNR